MKNKRVLLPLLGAALLASACGGKDDIHGKWQLEVYCFGSDCVQLADHNIQQFWELNDEAAPCDGDAVCFKGRQYQDSVMDNEIVWSLCRTRDTLFTSSPDGENPDTLLVTHLDGDTLILTSLMNNILVSQQFVRR